MEYSKLFSIMLAITTACLVYQAAIDLHWLDLIAIPFCGFTALYLWHKNKPNDYKRPKRKQK